MNYYVGHQLRKMRIQLGYSQEYVAMKLKISQSSYSQIENSKDSITLSRLNKLAEIFNSNPLDLIQINGEPINYRLGGSPNNHADLFEKSISRHSMQQFCEALKAFISILDKNRLS